MIGVGAFAMAAAAAFGIRQLIPPPAPQAVCVYGLDTVGASSTSQMFTQYQQWLPAQIRDCAQADRAQIDSLLISGETATRTTPPVEVNLRDLNYTGNGPDDDQIAQRAIARYTAKVKKNLFNVPAQGRHFTDLIAIGCVVAPMLTGHPNRTLTLFTDGMNGRAYNFARIPMDDSHLNTYIHQLRASGQICNLSGTQVKMYGVGIGTSTNNMQAQRLSQIEKFWELYFAASKASLVAYQRTP